MSFKERTDVTAVPGHRGWWPRRWSPSCWPAEALRKFGGDSLDELVRNHDGFVAALR